MTRQGIRKSLSLGMVATLAVAVVGLATGCPPEKKVQGSWKQAGSLTYDVREQDAPGAPQAQPPRDWELKLEFQDTGVLVTEMGVPFPGRMDRSGRLTAEDPTASPVLYELLALAVLPPGDGALKEGQTWQVTRPEDAEALASKALVGQEQFTYRIRKIDGGRVEVEVKGRLRIAPSAGLKALLEKHGSLPAGLTAPMVARYAPYAEGTAVFDAATGIVLEARGQRVPWAYMGNQDVAARADHVLYTVTRRGGAHP
ncbi:hypothetical protein [Pyxidicoccus sp. MSG2]|uniref:hypothetical protein n=1 Tax=Pyxidicoccus sp. MSG2 TaxID=2996790 RepID=UPI00226E4476|nr:hypothetical protein [Pyxidicoccus sp. MSG2]MCY1016565.1 hypothetical protein [Pyxidicoccus sp. MSG2]